MVPSPKAHRRTNPLAIGALVCGVIQFACLPVSIVTIVLGHWARHQIRRTGEHGSGLAKAGLILGYTGLAFILLLAMLMLLVYIAPLHFVF
jgi:uncharacterized membrane protein YidH (DUF202 family)